jgi:hypothetical protein
VSRINKLLPDDRSNDDKELAGLRFAQAIELKVAKSRPSRPMSSKAEARSRGAAPSRSAAVAKLERPATRPVA